MDVGLALVVCLLMVSMTAVQSQIEKGPLNALKKVGDSVTLECITVSKNCKEVDWAKVEGLQSPKLLYRDRRDGTGMLNTDVYPPQRYSVNNNGGCSLTITQLQISDSGRFICMQVVGDKEEERRSILVVIGMVTGSCVSNSNALDKGDGYSLWCAINVPAKSVEPSDVELILPAEVAAGEINTTTNGTQPRTTLNGIATKDNITQRVCRASFPPSTQDHYDSTTATLDVCTTQQLIVSYPVENIAVSPSGPYYEGDTVRCTADGHPPPTFKWTHLKSGAVVENNTLVINKGDAGGNFTFTATNTFKGKQTSQSITIEVSSTPPPSPPPGCVSGIVICVCRVIIIVVVVYFGGWLCGFWGLSLCCLPLVICWNNCICCKRCICEIKDKKDERANVRLTNSTSSGPEKPPRGSEKPNRPSSECQYAELRPEPNPHQLKPNPVSSSTHYASVAIA